MEEIKQRLQAAAKAISPLMKSDNQADHWLMTAAYLYSMYFARILQEEDANEPRLAQFCDCFQNPKRVLENPSVMYYFAGLMYNENNRIGEPNEPIRHEGSIFARYFSKIYWHLKKVEQIDFTQLLQMMAKAIDQDPRFKGI